MILRYVLVLFGSVTMISLLGCGDEGDDGNEGDVVTLGCGPNATLHGGLGNVEPHCDCNAGFTMSDGNCIPENSQGSDDTTPDTPAASDENDDANEDVGQGDQPEMISRALPVSCWRPPGSECDPRNATGCDLAAGETCDIAQNREGEPNIVCLAGPNPQGVGDSCEPANGPFCGAGLHCAPPGICKSFCCDDSDCTDGLSCQAFGAAAGTLGLCDDAAAAPSCGPPGASCRSASECCSRDCHAGHCH